MNKLITRIFLASCFLGSVGFLGVSSFKQVVAQSQKESELFYTYNGQKIPLRLRQDVIAVEATPPTRGSESQPFYLRLRQVLKVRGGNSTSPNPTVNPLGDRYALVSLPEAPASNREDIKRQLRQEQQVVQNLLPVFTVNNQDGIAVLTNEIVVKFKSGLSEQQKQQILSQNGAEIITPLPLSQTRYLVRAKTASGPSILGVANQLSSVPGVQFATPNFIRSVPQEVPQSSKKAFLPETPLFKPSLTKEFSKSSTGGKAVFKTAFLPLQWHLDSGPLTRCLGAIAPNSRVSLGQLVKCANENPDRSKLAVPRTDIHATEAWQQSNRGRGVVIAVIDAVFQVDHPNLKDSLYKVTAQDKCPGEVYGWNFSKFSAATQDPQLNKRLDICALGSANPGLSNEERDRVRTIFQDTFTQKDAELTQQYMTAEQIETLKRQLSKLPPEEFKQRLPAILRGFLRHNITDEIFHATMVSGVVAAQSHGDGVIGVAPNAKILPVRVFELVNPASLKELLCEQSAPSCSEQQVQFVSDTALGTAISYAADRGADIINMSVGGGAPTDVIGDAIQESLATHPGLVIVASAGNSSLSQMEFPASIPSVVAVGATGLDGYRASYSGFGRGLGVVAPGGDTDSSGVIGGILTTGGTWGDDLWQGLPIPDFRQQPRWGKVLDPRGGYVWTQGTSFSSPTVAGVLALMKGEDPSHRLNRDRLVTILKETASYKGLKISEEECTQAEKASQSNVNQYFFGSGLVNAELAVKRVKEVLQGKTAPIQKQTMDLCRAPG